MKEINFTESQLKDALKGNYVASGSEASIYKYKDHIAIRLYDVGDSIFCPVTGKAVGRPLCEKMAEKKSKLILNVEIYKIKKKIFCRFFSSRKLENLYHDKKTSHGV